jgi:hypothetical protein
MIIGEMANIRRFRSRDTYARHNSTAPLAGGSGNRERHRLARTGNHQVGAALHRIATTQAAKPTTPKTESSEALEQRLSDAVHRALLAEAKSPRTHQAARHGTHTTQLPTLPPHTTLRCEFC